MTLIHLLVAATAFGVIVAQQPGHIPVTPTPAGRRARSLPPLPPRSSKELALPEFVDPDVHPPGGTHVV